jgi:thioredoxin-like negative regulator of GroEL
MKELKVIKAVWCGPCKLLGPTLEKMVGQFKEKDCTVTYLDADECRDEVTALGVRGVPTMIAFNDGVETGRLSGNKTEAEILGLINK